ncbi:uncharacterized protein LOC131646432 isoform X2 [Vicia villosa]|uniref:uncharacterized protein LOC131643093 isoform X2 n=1 Tax=Vicia villosa TaxID=3911 RepID=UPI00273B230A|nr:uncharacterized protein LOC131643093 isoform X2 [Vicia villosa]XP_058772446.1 uncharacterized protein LOC131646432 isoform X2 [Vicia villosa]
MTIMQSEQPKHGQQEKSCNNLHNNFDLNVTAQELEEEPDLQCELIENHYSQYREKHVDNHNMETDKHEELVPRAKTSDGSVDHLLILAQSAEILAAQSEDSGPSTHTTNNQNQDHTCSQELLDRSSSGTRLTQIRKQARSKYLISDQDTDEVNQCKPLQGKTVRLSEIKHQARCKSKNDLSSSQTITGLRNYQRQGKILRLSQMKHQARSKNNAAVKEGTEEHMCISQHSNRDRVMRDSENHKECQHDAKRLRSFKTKKPKKQLRTECVRSSAGTRLQDGAILPKHKDLISCRQELPQTSGCTEDLETNFSVNKLRAHHGSNESSELRCESLQYIPNRLPVPNNVLLFTGLPNYTFQLYDPNFGPMLYMNHVQLKEYHRVISRRHRADRIKELRALKYKQQKSKNYVLEVQKENLPVKRLRLTQLRREVRIGNQCSVMQGPGEN